MTEHWTVTAAERAADSYAQRLRRLCYHRLNVWRADFAKRAPRLHGRIIFGNGCELLKLANDSKLTGDLEDYPRAMAGLRDALDDIRTMTNDYALTAPDDFTF